MKSARRHSPAAVRAPPTHSGRNAACRVDHCTTAQWLALLAVPGIEATANRIPSASTVVAWLRLEPRTELWAKTGKAPAPSAVSLGGSSVSSARIVRPVSSSTTAECSPGPVASCRAKLPNDTSKCTSSDCPPDNVIGVELEITQVCVSCETYGAA